MESSIPEYRRYLQLVLRRKELFAVTALAIMTVVFVVSFLLPKRFESSSTVLIEDNVISEIVKGITVTPSMEDAIRVVAYAITSRPFLIKVLGAMGIDVSRDPAGGEALIKELQASTQVKLKDKHLFTISFVARDPQFARDFVNTLVRVYIDQSMASKRGESNEASRFLSEQIASFNSKLEKAEHELNNYKREKGSIIAIDEKALYQEINTAQQKLYDLELRRHQLEGMRQATRKTSDPLLSKLATLQKKLDDLLVQYTENFPEVIQVKTEMETVREQLKGRRGLEYQGLDPVEMSRIESEIDAIRVSEAGLQRYIDNNKSLLQHIPAARAGLEKLELERQNQKTIYDQLFARQGQSEVSKQIESQDKSTTFRVIDPAILPLTPSSPNRLKIMLMGIAGGLATSFGLLLLLDQLDGSVKDVEFVKGLEAQVLAVIPKMQHPVLQARDRRRTAGFLWGTGIYFLVLLSFPVMEMFNVPYLEWLTGSLPTAHADLPHVGLNGGRGSAAAVKR
jgi:polysaccharide chain length determinant protein (PEP-CTERM system associated)